MAQNSKLDPVLKDYVVVNGSPVTSDDIYEPAYYALAIPRNQWQNAEDSNEGSDLYEFQNAKRLNDTEQLFAARANKAIQDQLIATGRAVQVETTNISSSPSGTSNNIAIQPSQQNISSQFAFTPIV